jgi:hypothetical protein
MITLIIAAISAADYKATTSIAVLPVPAMAVTAKPYNLVAVASNGLPVTYQSKTPTLCTVAGAAVTPKLAGVCVIVAKTAATTAYSAGQAPVEFAITAVLGPPPTLPLSIKITNPKAAGNYAAGIPIAIETEITGTDISRVEIHNSCSSPYFSTTTPPFATNFTPTSTGTCTIYAEVAAKNYTISERSADVVINVQPGLPAKPWTTAQKFFASCLACPSTAKFETESCPTYDIVALDGSECVDSSKCKWVKL